MRAWRRSSVNACWSAFSALALACAVLLSSACSRPAALVIGRIALNTPPELDNLGPERDVLRQALQKHLDAAPALRFAPDSRSASHVLQLNIGDEVVTSDGVTRRPLQLALRPLQDGAEFLVEAEPQVQTQLLDTVLAGVETGFKSIDSMRKLDVARDPELLAALTSPDPRLRQFAVERAGTRRLPAAVQPLCDLLRDESNARLVLKAIGSLVAIGDARAVEPLIELAHQKDNAFVLQIVFAVGAIGGRTAEAYLVTVASGHPDEQVQRAAQDALTEMARKSTAAKRADGA